MTQSEAFLAEIEDFLRRTGMKPSAFGSEAVNDPNLVFDLRNGRKPNLDLAERIRLFMAQDRPSSESAA